MRNLVITAETWTGQKLYWTGFGFGDNPKEDVNHRDFGRAIEHADRNIKSLNLVEIDHFDGSAEILKSEELIGNA
ncbi:MAG: hypothetical protein F2563_03580 [Actinobacteria bacterium]|uniref:Unannotated protein n=1 Tax=freshwater metagenome TaxID=449393 RepID=A0A6J6EN53_9ZZZZ|nr:hypothetical protein [Actinomycetota bacterium]